eukprot:12539749-Heterocapsa_arctica.AAC.1
MALDCTLANTTDLKDLLGDIESFKEEHVATTIKKDYPTPTEHLNVLVEFDQIGETCCVVKTVEDLNNKKSHSGR